MDRTHTNASRVPSRSGRLRWLGWLLALAAPLAQAQAPRVEYIHTDALGSPVAITNAAAEVIERTDWQPYGAAIDRPAYEGVGYTGHVMDGATGLVYMQQRYYDQSIGRFLSVDPVAANPSTGASFNRYWYANSNPYRFSDPDGRDAADRAYGAVVGHMLRNDPEKLRIWAGGEAAATTEGSAAEQGAGMGAALGRFFDTGDYSRDAVGRAAATVFIFAISRGRADLPRLRVQDITRQGAAERNYRVNWTQGQFEGHLKANGYTSQSSKDGKVTNWFDEDGNKAFTTRSFSKSAGASAEIHVKGEVAAKIRFEEEQRK